MAVNSGKFLKSLIGKKLLRVRRQMFVNDYAFYGPENPGPGIGWAD